MTLAVVGARGGVLGDEHVHLVEGLRHVTGPAVRGVVVGDAQVAVLVVAEIGECGVLTCPT